jgi:uncharacterized protein (TIGR03437 family)
MSQSAIPAGSITSVVNAASYQAGISAGALGTLFGAHLSPVVGIESPGGAMTYKGVSVTVGGRLAPLFAVANVNGKEQINFQVPAELPASDTTETVQVNNNGAVATISAAISPIQPGVFGYVPAGGSTAYGVVVKPDGSIIGPANPATRGSMAVIYMTGLGPTSPALQTAQPGPVPLAFTINPVEVAINGVSVTAAFSGATPGFIGLNQVNFTVPTHAPVGSDETLTVTVNGVVSPSVAIAVD